MKSNKEPLTKYIRQRSATIDWHKAPSWANYLVIDRYKYKITSIWCKEKPNLSYDIILDKLNWNLSTTKTYEIDLLDDYTHILSEYNYICFSRNMMLQSFIIYETTKFYITATRDKNLKKEFILYEKDCNKELFFSFDKIDDILLHIAKLEGSLI